MEFNGQNVDFSIMNDDEKRRLIETVGKSKAFADASHPEHLNAVTIFAELHGCKPQPLDPPPVTNELKQILESPAFRNPSHSDHSRLMREYFRLNNVSTNLYGKF
jgi:hypothetical protein